MNQAETQLARCMHLDERHLVCMQVVAKQSFAMSCKTRDKRMLGWVLSDDLNMWTQERLMDKQIGLNNSTAVEQNIRTPEVLAAGLDN